VVRALDWWSNGHSYRDDMKVLELGAYDAILGYDWLHNHSLMYCDWKERVVTFEGKGKLVQLIGDGEQVEVWEVSTVQLDKWLKGNEVWVCALLEEKPKEQEEVISANLKQLLEKF
jgi:hypothetical protein